MSFFKNIYTMIKPSEGPFKIPLLFIALFLVLFIRICAFIVNSYYYSGTISSVREASKEAIEQLGKSVFEKFDYFTEDLQDLAVSTAAIFVTKENVSLSNEQLVLYMLEAVKIHPEVYGFYFATPNGNLLYTQHLDAAEKRSYKSNTLQPLPEEALYRMSFIDNTVHPAQEFFQYKNDEFETIGSETLSVNYDPRITPWYLGAQEKHGIFWTDIYKDNLTGTPTMTVSCPAYNKEGDLQVIIGVDLLLKKFEDFLSSQKIGKHGQAIILDENGQILIADPKIFQPGGSEISEALVRKAFERFTLTGEPYFLLTDQEREFMVSSLDLPLAIGHHWDILVIVPINDFFGAVFKTHQQAYLFSFIMLIFTALLAIYIVSRISLPVIKLSKEVNRIKHLDLESPPLKIHTVVKEIHMMADAIADMKTALHSFARYVPRDIVNHLLQEGKELAIGGEKKEVTIFFSDIEKFTTIAEELPPEVLLSLLEEYFDLLSKIILKSQGTIDKYIGDSIMALWGTPAPMQDQATCACHAALECRNAVFELNKKRREEGKREFPTRIGIHTGTVIAGNIGTIERMNYTVIGDAVNSAARLQAINKDYHTQIIISDTVYEKTGNRFLVRPLDIVAVKGKEKKIKMFELFGEFRNMSLAPSQEQIELCSSFYEAFTLFEMENYSKAQELFQAIQKRFPADFPTQLYLQRLKKVL